MARIHVRDETGSPVQGLVLSGEYNQAPWSVFSDAAGVLDIPNPVTGGDIVGSMQAPDGFVIIEWLGTGGRNFGFAPQQFMQGSIAIDGSGYIVVRFEGGASGLSALPEGAIRVDCSNVRAIGRLSDGTCYADAFALPGNISPNANQGVDFVPGTAQPNNGAELWHVYIETAGVNPILPNWAVDLARTRLAAGGWNVSSIYPEETGYGIDLERSGSITLILAVTAIVAILAFVTNNGISSWRATRISDNAVEQGNNQAAIVNDIKTLCEQGLISSEECDTAIRNITEGGISDPTDVDTGSGFDIGTGSSLGILAIGAIAVLALSRR